MLRQDRVILFGRLAALILVTLSAVTKAAEKYPVDGYGMYESCPPYSGQICYDHLRILKKHGYSLVLNYSGLSGDDKQVLAYADAAQSHHIKIIWQVLSHYMWDGSNATKVYPDMGTSCHCSTNEDFVKHVVNLVKNHPATWGYYVGDEVSPEKHTEQKHFSDIVKETDPLHPRLMTVGTYTCDSRPKGCYANEDLATFADTAEVLAQDYYPVGYNQSLVSMDKTSVIARGVQDIADKYHRDSAMVLQAMSWQNYYPPARCTSYPQCAPFPSKEDQRFMLSQVLKESRPRLILWYSYFDILKSPDPESHIPVVPYP